MITETQGTQVKSYTYNIGDLATAFTVTASGSSVTSSSYGYDALGRMTQMSGTGGASASAAYTYDANSNPLTVTYGNGVQQAYTYNAGNLITQLTASKGSTSLLNKAYTYDLAGRQLGFTDTNGTTSYGYDALGQLVTESRTGTNAYTRSYTYDSRGNRTAMTADGVNTNYSYNAANQLTGSSGPASIAYTYDNAGNLLTESTGGTVSAQYTYNADNQLTGVQNGTTRYAYTYHPNGLRKTKAAYNASNVLQNSTTYTWSGDALVMETVGSTNKRYFYGLDLVAGTSGTTATTNYFTHDAHGSVALTTNTSGAAVQPYEYDAFGNLLNAASGDTNPFRYSGEYFDSETGNYYLRARYYDPTVGRFTQQDTIKDSNNWYIYCTNDPINRIDPSGLKDIMVRPTIENLGGTVTWSYQTKQATVYLDGKSTTLYSGDQNGSYIDENGKMHTDDAWLSYVLSATYSLKNGWAARIERDLSGGHGLQHVHLTKGDKYYAQIENGRPSHVGSWSDNGGPPKSVKKDLKERTGWDWDSKEKNWLNKIKLSYEPSGHLYITYPEGRKVTVETSNSYYFTSFFLRKQDLITYSYGPTRIDRSGKGITTTQNIFIIQNTGPISLPIPAPIPVPVIP